MFDLPETRRDAVVPYTGKEEWFQSYLMLEEMEEGNGSHKLFTTENCDTSLFPYFAQGPLPGPIPTPAEIAAAMPPPQPGKTNPIWRVGPYMVKTTHSVEIFQEAENMLYLEKNSNVRTAKVYAAFSSAEVTSRPAIGDDEQELEEPLTQYYLVTEIIEGMPLARFCDEHGGRCRPSITTKISEMLGEQLRRLRSIAASDGVDDDEACFSRINKRPFPHTPSIAHPVDAQSRDWGPFTYEDFVKRIMHTSMIRLATSRASWTPPFEPLERQMFQGAKRALIDHAGPEDRAPVLGHLDLHGGNILVKLKFDEEGKPIDVVHVVLVDWEYMAWVPPWFEVGDIYSLSTWDVDAQHSVMNEVLNNLGELNMPMALFWGYGLRFWIFLYNH